jgi:hypothetical protein
MLSFHFMKKAACAASDRAGIMDLFEHRAIRKMAALVTAKASAK